MIKIKLSISGAGSNINASQFLGNNENIYKNCKFFINQEINDPDFWFIIEHPENAITIDIDPNKVLWGTAEVSHPVDYYMSSHALDFLQQFAKVYTCFNSFNENSTNTLPFLPWMINSNHGNSIFKSNDRDYNFFSNLTNLPKEKTLSVICSSKAHTPEHFQRLEFVKKIKNHFKDKIDWYGNGIQPLNEKWDGIAPYKYHLVIENHFRYNIITEKLIDSFMGLSYPIYYGAPNIFEYFPTNSLTAININDLKSSIKVIESVIYNNTYENSMQYLLKAKELCLNKYNMFHRIGDICINEFYKNPTSNNISKVKICRLKVPFKEKLFTKLTSYTSNLLNINRTLNTNNE